MTDPKPSSGTQSKIIEVVMATAAVVAAIAGISALDSKLAIVVTLAVSTLVMAGIAVHAWRRGSQALLKGFMFAAAVLALATAGFSLAPAGLIEGDAKPAPVQRTTRPPSRQPSSTASSLPTSSLVSTTTATTTPTATAQTEEGEPRVPPVFEGTVDIKPGQMVDFEATPLKVKTASGVLVEPYDLRIDATFTNNIYDRDGYVIPYSDHPNKGREGCRELLEADKPRTPYYSIPNHWACLLTSEGRIGLVLFGGSDLTTINSLRYMVWDK